MQIYQLKQQGFKIRPIARKLGISRTTVYKYLEKSPEEMSEWVASTTTRTKKLDPYEMLIQTWLSEHPDLSGSQVHDWLKERYHELHVGESTVRSYVKELREKYSIPKTESKRVYQAIKDSPMGQQAQVDFGQTIQKNTEGKEVRLYFISFVLSNSRYKYVEWLDRPFTTKDVIRTHENAFEAYEGIPYEIVYDQDSLIVVSENAGDLILTSEFQAYRNDRQLKLFVCRKADPESKGKIENVVGFIKKNFAKNRVFNRIDQWNEQCLAWLERTGNGRVHNSTKKKPAEVFALEKQHLRPVTRKISISNVNSSIARTVRKDNTIIFKSNRYSVPLGTYNKGKEVYIEKPDDDHLNVLETPDGPIIAQHQISLDKGKLIQDRKHTRDRSKGIPAFMKSISEEFEDPELAYSYLEEIYQRYPRYMRDQLQLLKRAIKNEDALTRSEALKECEINGIYSATEFRDVIQYINRQRQVNIQVGEEAFEKQTPLHYSETSNIHTKPQTRSVNDYLELLKGGAPV